MEQTVEGWTNVVREGQVMLERVFAFKTFGEAMQFATRVAEVADAQDHHPEIVVSWGRCIVRWWSHDEGGVSARDISLAEATNRLY
ncbi:MAG: 4a-hydroxytetrahydrobiopterin dehydratase [Gammaproteobacteria bacterium]|nr:4a-hydroxytetrahydrobiopterin dehydratase [Gammaproteobacteria bacterium]